jgi:hypothetical protein
MAGFVRVLFSHLCLNSDYCIGSHFCIVSHMDRKPLMKKSIARVAASTLVMTAGLGLAALGGAAITQAQPAPFPDYRWCPGAGWDPGWGQNWDWGRCHDDHWYDGEPRDGGHWHGYGGF